MIKNFIFPTLKKLFLILLLAIFLWPSLAEATWAPPGGNNNDIQYRKNGYTFGGSDNFVLNGSNVGIGSVNPTQALDVIGTVKASYFTGNGSLLTGISSSQWTSNGSDVYLPNSGNVGIGTSLTSKAALSIMNGNVGIGTWVPSGLLAVGNVGGGQGGTTLRVTSDDIVKMGYKLDGYSPAHNVNLNFLEADGNPNLYIARDSSGGGTGYQWTAINIWNNRIYMQNNQTQFNGYPVIASSTDTNPGGLTSAQFTVTSGPSQKALQFGFYSSPAYTAFIQNLDNVPVPRSIALNPLGGNIGIGTDMTNASGKLIVIGGNIGINTITPGQTIDVKGTIRTTNFTMTGQSPISGYVLTASDSAGDTTWSSAGGVSGWTTTGNDVYETASGNVGIGTTIVTNAALSVMNGNVGVGTWVPSYLLSVNGNVGISSNSRLGTSNGTGGYKASIQFGDPAYDNEILILRQSAAIARGIYVSDGGTSTPVTYTASEDRLGVDMAAVFNNSVSIGNGYIGYLSATKPTNGLIVQGNVGVGSWLPAQMLDVKGTAQMTGFKLTTNPSAGYVLTSDSLGVGTWMPAASGGGSSQWITTNTNDVYLPNSGNVGIGTIITNFAALSVMNGNVGVGTWVPIAPLQVNGTSQNVYISPSGNLGIGTWVPKATLSVNGNGYFTGSGLFGSGSNGALYQGNAVLQAWANGSNTGNQASFINIQSGSGDDVNDFLIYNQYEWLTGIDAQLTYGSKYRYKIADATNTGNFSNTRLYIETINDTTPGTVHLPVGLNVGEGKIVINGSSGNVGIGSTNPGQKLDVQGTTRTTNLTVSGQSPVSGYVLTASDTAGDTTWSSAGGVSGWTITNTNDVYETSGGNVGIGTTITNNAALTVMNGNVGIGTWVPATPFQVNGSSQNVNISSNGNLGIGVKAPSYSLDIFGSARIGNSDGFNNWVFDTTGQATMRPSTGTAIIALDTGGGSALNISPGYTFPGNHEAAGPDIASLGAYNLGLTSYGGTLLLDNNTAGGSTFTVRPGIAQHDQAGTNLIILGGADQGTTGGAEPGGSVYISGSSGYLTGSVGNVILNYNGSSFVGNVGISSLHPGQTLDVTGTIRTTNFTMTGQSPISGYVLTASDSAGDTTWSSAGGVSGWTIAGNDVYETAGGNVGIGTTITGGGALSIMNGNVGVGTWVPSSTLVINGSLAGGNVVISANTSLNSSHYIVNVDATASAVNVTLPTAIGIGGRCYQIKDVNGFAVTHNITISTTAAQTIDGQSNAVIAAAYNSDMLCSTGTNWGLY